MTITPANRIATHRLSGVEFLRGMAATLVMLAHASHIISDHGDQAFGNFWQFGRAGVDFFFVLSGFIIAFVHAEDIGMPTAFRSFWIKRVVRIYPLYILVTIPWLLLLWISPTADRSERDVMHVLASLVLWPEVPEPVLGVGWSLRHELAFYAMFSLMIWRKRLGEGLMLLWFAVILGGMVYQMFEGEPPFGGGSLGTVFLRGFNLDFIFGIVVARILRQGALSQARWLLTAGVVIFLATGMYESYGPLIMHEWPVRNLSYALGAALMLAGMGSLDMTGIKTPRLAIRLGAASYSIYLVHLPVLVVLEFGMRFMPHIHEIPIELRHAAAVLVTLAIGVAVSEIVEQPLLRWMRKRLLPRREVRLTPQPAAANP